MELNHLCQFTRLMHVYSTGMRATAKFALFPFCYPGPTCWRKSVCGPYPFARSHVRRPVPPKLFPLPQVGQRSALADDVGFEPTTCSMKRNRSTK